MGTGVVFGVLSRGLAVLVHLVHFGGGGTIGHFRALGGATFPADVYVHSRMCQLCVPDMS